MTDYSKTTGSQGLEALLGLLVIIGFSLFFIKSCFFSSSSDDVFDSADAISACKEYHINNNVDVQIFGYDRADVQGDGWFVVITTKNDGYRRCSVSKSGRVFNTN